MLPLFRLFFFSSPLIFMPDASSPPSSARVSPRCRYYAEPEPPGATKRIKQCRITPRWRRAASRRFCCSAIRRSRAEIAIPQEFPRRRRTRDETPFLQNDAQRTAAKTLIRDGPRRIKCHAIPCRRARYDAPRAASHAETDLTDISSACLRQPAASNDVPSVDMSRCYAIRRFACHAYA